MDKELYKNINVIVNQIQCKITYDTIKNELSQVSKNVINHHCTQENDNHMIDIRGINLHINKIRKGAVHNYVYNFIDAIISFFYLKIDIKTQ